MKTLIKLLIKAQSTRDSSESFHPTSGFTMIELLVGTIIAFLITVPMLGFVVDMLNRDVQEQAKANTEQDIQAAVDYIAEDMSQAIYIYDLNKTGKDATEQTAIDTFLANFTSADAPDGTPVLVFWKRQLVENALSVSENAICSGEDCNDAYVLSLVAYYFLEDNSQTWCQPQLANQPCGRISRFQIQDGVKAVNGDYVCGSDGDSCTDEQTKFNKSDGFSDYPEEPITWTKSGDFDESADVLVNYIESFELKEGSTNDLAKIEIVGNTKRRIPGQFQDVNCGGETSSYCPKVNAQIGGRSRKIQ